MFNAVELKKKKGLSFSIICSCDLLYILTLAGTGQQQQSGSKTNNNKYQYLDAVGDSSYDTEYKSFLRSQRSVLHISCIYISN